MSDFDPIYETAVVIQKRPSSSSSSGGGIVAHAAVERRVVQTEAQLLADKLNKKPGGGV